MIILVLIVVGLAMGSFVNALVWRVHAQDEITDKAASGQNLTKADEQRLGKLSISKGRSMCLHCGHELAARDLVPVVSWLALGGKCRYCGAHIPDTPLAELLVPALFVASYIWWPWTPTGWGMAVFVSWLAAVVLCVALLIYDAKWFLLPDRVVLPLTGVAVVFRTAMVLQSPSEGLHTALAGLWGVVLLAGLFYMLFVVSNEQWIGGGDVKLAVALGLLAGGPLASLLLLFVASISGTFAAVPLVVGSKSIRGARIPFGPFLIGAVVFTVLFGQPILNWYSGLFIT